MTKIGKVLVSPSKLGILITLSKNGKPVSFSELKEAEGQTSGNLNYHLLTLQNDGLMEKTKDGRYELTGSGRQALEIVKKVAKT
ncbi:MAG: helix-turn-helix domain-containing protein [Candidatus Bathyarchaeia archaeon]